MYKYLSIYVLFFICAFFIIFLGNLWFKHLRKSCAERRVAKRREMYKNIISPKIPQPTEPVVQIKRTTEELIQLTKSKLKSNLDQGGNDEK